MLIGHELAQARLGRSLPPVVLLQGLSGVGKWALAVELIQQHCAQHDVLFLRTRWGVREARQVGKFVQSPPVEGSFRGVAADLETASPAAQTALLKVLEEPPEHARFILVAPPATALLTVVSRAAVVRCRPLTIEQTREVLEAQGLSGPQAAAAAALVPGRPGAAQRQAQDAEAAQERVRGVLAAARDNDTRSLDRLFRNWGDAESRLLGVWSWEAATGNWRVFSTRDAPRQGVEGARRIIQSRALSNALPQIADRRTLDFAIQQQII